jgi:hypothetical protein
MKSLKWVVIIAIILIGIGLIFNYSTNYYVIVSFFIVLFSIDNFSIFFSDRFFKDSVSSYFILFFLFTYILYFTYDTVKNYYGLENKKATNFIFEIKDNSIDMDNLKLINSNSNYFFFYDTIKLESVITERDNIKTIRIK